MSDRIKQHCTERDRLVGRLQDGQIGLLQLPACRADARGACDGAEAERLVAAITAACSAGEPRSRSRPASCTELAFQDSRRHVISRRQALQRAVQA